MIQSNLTRNLLHVSDFLVIYSHSQQQTFHTPSLSFELHRCCFRYLLMGDKVEATVPPCGDQDKGSDDVSSLSKCTTTSSKTRFNWKHRNLTSHAANGSNGQVIV